MRNKVSIVIPAYNEEKRIGKTLEEYYSYFAAKKKEKILKNFEIIVVCNACRDNTQKICEDFSKGRKEIRVLNFKQGGKGFAITEGFKDALKRDNYLIGFVDADMATPPEAFYDLVEKIGGYEGIIASRWLKKSVIKTRQSLIRRFVSRGFNFIVRIFFFLPYRDTQCGAKLFKKEALQEVVNGFKITEWAFDVNLLYLMKKGNKKIKEIPTTWEDKDGTKITNVLRASLQMFLGVFRLRLIYSVFEKLLRPVKFILQIGDWIIRRK